MWKVEMRCVNVCIFFGNIIKLLVLLLLFAIRINITSVIYGVHLNTIAFDDPSLSHCFMAAIKVHTNELNETEKEMKQKKP